MNSDESARRETRDPVAPAGHAAADDDALVRRIAAGDSSAWTQLAQRHLAPLVALAWRILGDRAEAEDVAQEVFVRLLAKVPAWEPGGAALRTWLSRVAINLCIDRRRARRTTPLDDLPEPRDPTADEAVVARRFDMARKVRAALHKLPERQGAALALVYYQGFSNREAANILEVSVDALESLLSRGRRAMKADLSNVAADLLEDW
ncbi:MAG: RNA polymerase sigma factor [Proteobacteria bacterium]|nr:RNA polymerase sigma factor [Pseudomonadota bacterium]